MSDGRPFGGMGTTLVCVLVLERQMVMAHVGDSRCYRLRKGTLKQLTDDHSLVASQVKAGQLSEKEAREAAHKNIITRAIGTSEHVKPDVVDGACSRTAICSSCAPTGSPTWCRTTTSGGCSRASASLEDRAASLVALANDRGGRDNITAVLVEYRAAS